MKTYKDLIVWQKSIDVVKEIYAITRLFPREEIYGLTNQMRRAAVSIPSNLAEGFSRGHKQENIQFIRIAFASGAELETQIHIAKELGMASKESFKRAEDLLDEVMKMLNSLFSKLKTSG